MSKAENRPQRIDAAELDDAVKNGVERAEKTNELTQGDLDQATGGSMPTTPGKITGPYVDQAGEL